MPSLEDRVNKAAAAKAEREAAEAEAAAQAQRAAQESEAAAQRAAEEAESLNQREALRTQLDGLLAARDALAKIKEVAGAVKSTDEERDNAKNNLRAKRGKIRTVHKKSLETDDVLPKPDEIISDPDFADVDEVKDYSDAREAFSLSATQAKKLRAELSELGVEDFDELLPGQLEAQLVESDTETTNEIRAFVLKHPEVDPEMEAQVREELVTERKNEILKNTPTGEYIPLREAFYGSLERGAARSKPDTDGRYYSRTLTPAVQNALEALTATPQGYNQGSPYRQQYYQGIDRVFKGEVDSISTIDTEAMRRAVVAQMVGSVSDGFYSNHLNLLKGALAREQSNENFGAPPQEQVKTPRQQERTEEEYRRERETAIAQVTDRILQSPNTGTERAVQTIVERYKKYAEYRRIPSEVQKLTERKDSIRKRLEGTVYRSLNSYAEEGTLKYQRNTLDRSERDLENEESRFTKKAEEIKGAPAKLLQLSNTLGSKELGLPITSGERLEVLAENSTEIRRLRNENDDAKKLRTSLDNAIRDVDTAKQGVFGTTSKEKKEALARLARTMDVSPDDKSFSIQSARDRWGELSRSIEQTDIVREELAARTRELELDMNTLSRYATLLGVTQYNGTVQGYITALRDAAVAALPDLEKERAELASRADEIRTKKRELDDEQEKLTKEEKTIDENIKGARKRMDELESELVRESVIEQPNPNLRRGF